ncbi:MAG: hypothetical protein WC346_08520 [Methanogenium sp.]|jgi:hypothetical protein
MDIKERKKALETLMQKKVIEMQSLETQKNNVVTEIVKIQGKIDLLNELETEEKKTKPAS